MMRRAERARRAGLVLVLALSAARPAAALVWPDVAERVERDLSAADPATRRAAARALGDLGPGRGGPLALEALGDPDDDVKLAAADAAIRLRVAGATDAVAGWLNAPDPRLRRKACDVARALPGPRAVTPLGRTLGDPDPEVRAAAADALGHQGSGEAVPPLLGRLDDPAPAVRIQIVAALSRIGDPRAVVPLVGKVQDSSPDVREAVARALGDLGDPRASTALVLVLRDSSTSVKRDALAALGRMRATDAVDAIAPFAADRAPPLRLAALSALGHIASPDAVRVLVQALGTADDAGASLDRSPVRDALVLAGAAAVPSLRALLGGAPSPAAATSAAWVLGEEKAKGEAGSIVAAMRRGALPTAAALHALAGAGTEAEVPVVLEFVDDPSPVVRGEALSTAMVLLDPARPDGRAVEPLAAALRDARPSVAERAKMAALLGRTGAARAEPLLVELVHAHDTSLRLAAIDAVGTLGRASRDPGAATRATDAALLEALASADATLRLHAAVALADAGGTGARDALLAKLDGGDEVDRAAVLTALGGVLARTADDAAVGRLVGALGLAAGPERDAVIEALGRARLPSAVKALTAIARGEEPWDRRAVAALLAGHAGDAAALETLRALLGDSSAEVRAEAAWSLGTVGDAADVAHLQAVSRSADPDAAPDAVAALGRIAARAHRTDTAALLCPLAGDARAYVRANALAGLALGGARCEGGAVERAALDGDASEDVRIAAARVLTRAPSAADSRALDRCARTDPSGSVAAECREHRGLAPPGPPASAALVYVVAEGAASPRPGAPYAMRLFDGMIRAGSTDRRGAVFDPAAPAGELVLRHPSALAR
jgi:HEAT repeat protein